MTQDESHQIEELLLIWHDYAKRDYPELGAPSRSPYWTPAESGDVYIDPDEVDERIRAEKASHVDFCISQLSWQQRSAIDIHAHIKATGVAVWRNPRLTREQHHSEYQAAKLLLLPMLRGKGMIRGEQ